jgi:hypothetical protein
MNTLTRNASFFRYDPIQFPRNLAHLLLGIGILVSTCHMGVGQEIVPMPSVSQDQAIENEEIPLSCLPLPTDLAGIELTADIQPRGKDSQIVSEEKLPKNCAQYVFSTDPTLYDDSGILSGGFAPGYNWAAAQFCHNPLYFEETALERCGVEHGCCQPFISGAHFFGSVALLPWKMWQQCPRSCECTPARDCVH